MIWDTPHYSSSLIWGSKEVISHLLFTFTINSLFEPQIHFKFYISCRFSMRGLNVPPFIPLESSLASHPHFETVWYSVHACQWLWSCLTQSLCLSPSSLSFLTLCFSICPSLMRVHMCTRRHMHTHTHTHLSLSLSLIQTPAVISTDSHRPLSVVNSYNIKVYEWSHVR